MKDDYETLKNDESEILDYLRDLDRHRDITSVGRCEKCDSKGDLEYYHVTPLSRGEQLNGKI